MKTFTVGVLLRVEAEDEDHAVEQFIDATGYDWVNYIREER